MLKYLILGDVHSTPSETQEVEKLLDFSANVARENNVKILILLGDLHDTHSIVHSEVTWSYFNAFKRHLDLHFILMVGNHDHPLRDRTKHVLLPYKSLKNVTVVDDLMHFEDFDAVPYCSEEELLKLCENTKSDTLLAHHTFKGAKYSNGFFDPHAIDLKKLSYKNVIPGHVHLSQTIDNCFYPGSPRWRELSDANEDKGIHLWDGKDNYKKISTENVCRKIVRMEITEENYQNIELNQAHRLNLILDIKGTALFVEEQSSKYKGLARIIPNINQKRDNVVSESLGIDKALEEFVLHKYRPEYGVDNEVLFNEIMKRMNSVE